MADLSSSSSSVGVVVGGVAQRLLDDVDAITPAMADAVIASAPPQNAIFGEPCVLCVV